MHVMKILVFTEAPQGQKHIVEYITTTRIKGLPCLVMEYVAGGNLFEQASTNPFSPIETGRFFSQAAKALEFIHERGIIHR